MTLKRKAADLLRSGKMIDYKYPRHIAVGALLYAEDFL